MMANEDARMITKLPFFRPTIQPSKQASSYSKTILRSKEAVAAAARARAIEYTVMK